MLEFVRLLCCAEKERIVDTQKFRRLVERIVGGWSYHLDDIITNLFRQADNQSTGKLTKSQIIFLFKGMNLLEINMKAFKFDDDGNCGLHEFHEAVQVISEESTKLVEVLVREGRKAKGWTKEAWDCCAGPDDKYVSFTVFAALMAQIADVCNTVMPEETELRAEMGYLRINNNDMFTQDEFGKLYLTFLTRMHLSGEETDDSEEAET
eukprot:TRINITY_DN28786_c0_g1_i1.p1 TRINITY_DN28786_c0_g1~~TRINITY_DN28786_c0_g1_i1.p1  ORF type:complete len:208 (-),score=33.56 TRINITY_DN28786_c0_g1_i1:156-779(-)